MLCRETERGVETGGAGGGRSQRETTHRHVQGASDVATERRSAYGVVETAINVTEECPSANCRVVVAQTVSTRVIKRERDITNGGVSRTDNIKESASAPKALLLSPAMLLKSARRPRLAEAAGIVKIERALPLAVLSSPGGVEQKRCYADSRIVVRGVEVKRSSANSSIEARRCY